MQYDESFIQNYPKKAYNKLVFPLIIFAVFNSFFLLIDTFWATMLGVETLIVVGLADPVFILLIKFGETLGQGTNSYISRCLGNSDLNRARNTLVHGVIVGLTISIFLAIVFILFIDLFFYLLNLSSVIGLAMRYIIPLVLCSFIFVLVHFFSETLQTEGDSKIPTVCMISGNIVKFILSPVFIFYFKLGIFSLALSTIIGLLVPFSIFMYIYFFKKNIEVYFNIKSFNLSFNVFKEIFKVTIPNFIDRSLYTSFAFFINSLFIFIGDPSGIAFYTFFQKVNDFINSPSRGAARGLLTITGHLYGSGKIKEIISLFKHGLWVTIIISFIVSVLFIIFHLFVFDLLGVNGNISNDINLIIICLVFVNMIIPVSFCSSKLFDGVGKSIYGLIGSFLLLFGSMALILIFVVVFNLNEYYILFSFVLIQMIATCYYLIVVHHIIKKESLIIS